ncbi:PIG-L deacetylase family protein [Actinomadura harenae]|uniref:PIG-L deacetylase family protein n=1 Tax=Actinomadura harenae TaxID=2483351 RepID=UPI0018F79AC9|nr:PIG-L family deacetylase [Actinomadura harenae]
MRRTCVFFHAHPDDESLLTAGTMARLAAEGHRVVLVVATAGERGLTLPVRTPLPDRPEAPSRALDEERDPSGGAHAAEAERDAVTRARLGVARTAELHASARALGCERVVLLGYEDSGLDGDAPGGFSRAHVEAAAGELAEVLRQEAADLLVVYDPAGGYGHPDHVQVHRVGTEAAKVAGTPVVLEATVDRDLLLRVLRGLAWLRLLPRSVDVASFERAYASGAEITHRVPVRRYTSAKRLSMAAHASQTTGGDTVRTLAALLWLPRPLFRRALGTEWYIRRDLPDGPVLRHPLDAWPLETGPPGPPGTAPAPASDGGTAFAAEC